MGLDTVDMIYKIEKHFSIRIPDQEAERMITIRNISDYIASASSNGAERRTQIETKVLTIVADHAGLELMKLSLDITLTNDLALD